jgi:hypothetical protein
VCVCVRVLTLIKYGFNTIGKRISTTRACLRASGLEGSRNRIGFVHLYSLTFCLTLLQRLTLISTSANKSSPSSPLERSSPSRSGYQTPKEINEEKWRAEEQTRPGKVEMREMYKELGGRKSRNKTKLGGAGGHRDRTGWGDHVEE